jgi:hypothetical protein
MSKLFDSVLIDLIEYGRRQRKLVSKRSFAWHIVAMADRVIYRYNSSEQLLGIRSCIRHQLQSLHWYDYMFFIPLSRNRYSSGTFELTGRGYILPNSIIATTLHYREALNEAGTGLRSIVLSEFVCGLEWVCYESIFGSNIETWPEMPLLEATKVEPYVH